MEALYREDREAFADLMRRHTPALLRFAGRLCGSSAQAEDVVQQAFLNLWRTVVEAPGGRKHGEASVRGWLFQLTRHAAYRAARRRVGEPAFTEELDPLMELGQQAGWGQDGNPERLAMTLESHHGLRLALEQLPTPDQEVLWLRDVEGLDGEEAAKVLDVPVGTMKTRLHRARLRLRAVLQAEVTHAR